jgi:hypothetical protein
MTPSKIADPGQIPSLKDCLASSSPPLWPPVGGRLHRVLAFLSPAVSIVGLLELGTLLSFAVLSSLALRGVQAGAGPHVLPFLICIAGSVCFIGKAYIVLLRELRREQMRLAYIHTLLGRIANDVLELPAESRVTWFEIDRIHRSVLVPRVRYSLDSLPAFCGSQMVSRSYYPRGVSFTGFAWVLPGVVHVHHFPPFHGDVSAMREYYERALVIPRDIVARISRYMAHVRTIICVGIEHPRNSGSVLGVISLDVRITRPEEDWRKVFQSKECRLMLDSLSDAILMSLEGPR